MLDKNSPTIKAYLDEFYNNFPVPEVKQLDVSVFLPGEPCPEDAIKYAGYYRNNTIVHQLKPGIDIEGVLSHEFGHFLCDISGFYDSPVLWDYFCKIRPKQATCEGNKEGFGAICEDFAECYRALFGLKGCKGYFSDNKKADLSPELRFFLSIAYFINKKSNKYQLSDLRFAFPYFYFTHYPVGAWFPWWKEEYKINYAGKIERA